METKVIRPRILIMNDFYLPDFRGGGPIQSISNLIERMSEEFQFYVLCKNRDQLDAMAPRQRSCSWKRVGKANVRYLSPGELTFSTLRDLLKENDFDLLYVNGYFSSFARRILILRLFRLVPDRPIVMAPRGEFSAGALGLKKPKKWAYLHVTRWIGFFDNLIWHATGEMERDDICRVLGIISKSGTGQVVIAPNLLGSEHKTDLNPIKRQKVVGSAQILFLSRIHPHKNLDYALKILSGVRGKVDFDIFGPVEDPVHWKKCQELINSVSGNINVRYKGEVSHDEVNSVFSKYHLFLFPTRSENFGHVIVEALGAGCPVATSDQTPWSDLCEKHVGWWIPLDQPEAFRAAVERIVAMGASEFTAISELARDYARTVADDAHALEEWRRMLSGARAF